AAGARAAVSAGAANASDCLITEKRGVRDRRHRTELIGYSAGKADSAGEAGTAAATDDSVGCEGAVRDGKRTPIVAIDCAAFGLGGEAGAIVARDSLIASEAAVANSQCRAWETEDAAAQRVTNSVVGIVAAVVSAPRNVAGQRALRHAESGAKVQNCAAARLPDLMDAVGAVTRSSYIAVEGTVAQGHGCIYVTHRA